MKKAISQKVKVGKCTLVEYRVVAGDEFDFYCEVKTQNDTVGGYISIQDAMDHRGEWDSNYNVPTRKAEKVVDCRGANIRSLKDLFSYIDKMA